jgi:hypothetical protein
LTGQITTEQIMVVSPDGRSASSSTAKPHIQDLRCVGDQPRRPSAATQEYLMTDTAWDDPHRSGAVPSTAARYVSPAPIDPLGLRARLMLETSSHLMAEPNWPYRQTTVEMRSQGDEEGIFRLFGANHPDSIRRVAERQLDVSIMNPSAILSMAHRGVGLFSEPMNVALIAVIPHADQLGFAVSQASGLRSLDDILPLRWWVWPRYTPPIDTGALCSRRWFGEMNRTFCRFQLMAWSVAWSVAWSERWLTGRNIPSHACLTAAPSF